MDQKIKKGSIVRLLDDKIGPEDYDLSAGKLYRVKEHKHNVDADGGYDNILLYINRVNWAADRFELVSNKKLTKLQKEFIK